MEGHEEAALAIEVEQLLSALSECNERMAQCVQTGTRTANAALLQRYREIYFDYKRDFDETACAIQRKREQVELFRGATNQRNAAQGEDTGMNHLYREQDAINSSLKSAGSVIGQADEVRSALWSQRMTLSSAGGTLGQIGNAYPSIGRVIVAIQQRKYRDNMVVGLVIASCICFTLWWLFG
mmetsp:Transcript_37189/g.100524  ORF Transcript_37189/g.100524 Transcript_37189/m.100524 type:complete len:182 (-) Transcript_37189:316-861(-)